MEKKKNWIKRHPILSLIILIFLVNFFLISLLVPEEKPQETDRIEEESIKNLEQKTILLEKENSIDKTSNEKDLTKRSLFLVTKIIDGDTIEIEGGERVRLICIDAPERGKPGYDEATVYLKNLILEKEVKLEKDISDKDRYGRLLRYVYLNGDFVNELIVRDGYGRAYSYNPDISRCPEIQNAEAEAKDDNLGIWKDENSQEKTSSSDNIDEGDYICTTNYYNCDDFDSHTKAQEVFEICGGKGKDIHRLDRDDDGIACETE